MKKQQIRQGNKNKIKIKQRFGCNQKFAPFIMSDFGYNPLLQTPKQKEKERNQPEVTPKSIESEDPHGFYLINNFHGDTKYSLNYINSIYFKDGKIYNLLERTAEKKTIKCGCIKSFCQAKYCECFRSGQACGDQCSCRDCKNTKSRKPIPTSLNQGCKCRKSGCSKKYCECFQNGRKCGSHCQCSNCCNGE